MHYHRIAYRSECCEPGYDCTFQSHLDHIVGKARDSNRSQGITSALAATECNFLQILEGPERAVEQTLARICRDPRHQRICILEHSLVAERLISEPCQLFPLADMEADVWTVRVLCRMLSAGFDPSHSGLEKLMTALRDDMMRAQPVRVAVGW